MNYFVLTQNSTPIFKWVVWALGLIMRGLYNAFSAVGIENIGLCIIVFTLVVKLLMLPLTIKQQKFTKLQAVMNPEIQAIQAKYKNKKDQQSQLAMQEEMKFVYEKYGTSPTGSCLQLIIQMPILLALYRVIMNVAAYVPQVKSYYTSIIDNLSVDYIKEAFDISVNSVSELTTTQVNNIVDILSGASRTGVTFDSTKWADLISQFPAAESYYNSITSINSIGFGINLSQSPAALVSAGVVIALAIPVLAGFSQWLSAVITNKISQANMPKKNDNSMNQTMNQSMKMMTIMMPLMSVFFCYSFASGIGVYWICTAVIQAIQTVAINKYFNKVDVQDIIDENLKKQKKKREKKGIYEDKVRNSANINTRTLSQKANVSATARNTQNSNSAGSANNNQPVKSSPGGIASKANMVRDYNSKK